MDGSTHTQLSLSRKLCSLASLKKKNPSSGPAVAVPEALPLMLNLLFLFPSFVSAQSLTICVIPLYYHCLTSDIFETEGQRSGGSMEKREAMERLMHGRSAFRVGATRDLIFNPRRKLYDGGAWLSENPPPPYIYHPTMVNWLTVDDVVSLLGSRRRRGARSQPDGVVIRLWLRLRWSSTSHHRRRSVVLAPHHQKLSLWSRSQSCH